MPNQPNSSVLASTGSQIHRIVPQRGVVTLFGYGIQVRVDRGHLILQDGIGPDRRHARLPKVGSGLERLVTIGNDGSVSLAALRWLADKKAAFVMLDRDGSVLCTTGPVTGSDARLRRAQACALQTDLGFQIARELIRLKLEGQQTVARERLKIAESADAVELIHSQLPTIASIDAVRICEARAAAAYWHAWRAVRVAFPKKHLRRTPEHWLSFGSRTSPLSGFSPRLAVNPINAILNYLYAILESEARLAIAAMGLDPGMGVIHLDSGRRDSLACDLMEAVRPEVDAFVLDWVARAPFSRDWFFEERNGNCRLMGQFAGTLSETAPRWRQAVAPLAEWLALVFWDQSPKMAGHRAPANRLTQGRKRSVQGGKPTLPALRASPPHNLCRTCGAPIMHKGTLCRLCCAETSKAQYATVAALGRKAALTPESQARRIRTQRRNARAQHGWIAANQPVWLDQRTYVRSNSAIAFNFDRLSDRNGNPGFARLRGFDPKRQSPSSCTSLAKTGRTCWRPANTLVASLVPTPE